MLVIFCIAVGVLLLPPTLPQDVEECTPKPLCKGGTYDEEYIRVYVVQTINNHRQVLLRGFEPNGQWNGTGYGKDLPLPKTMNKVVSWNRVKYLMSQKLEAAAVDYVV
ncbi:hypothetical protein NECAME_01695 [Necator americanus]|uniref:Uncharacterized protein n=1 Tax=Necator americanus TaxID=51031 RepID=W2TSB7_NECAM|nr:hypothetical protein NECAME_01695 [Necator americanus]ETN83902.1 hypothetical protein NECAME_01695 [Necator americanus]